MPPAARCCCISQIRCLYLIDAYERETVNPEGSDRYTFTPEDWEIDTGRLVCVTTDSPIHFKNAAPGKLLEGYVEVDFTTGSNFTLMFGVYSITLTKLSDTEIEIDGVVFTVDSLTTNPIVQVSWNIPALRDCKIKLSADINYLLDPLNTDCDEPFTYPTHLFTVAINNKVGPGSDVSVPDSDEMKFVTLQSYPHGFPADSYILPIVIDEDSYETWSFKADAGIALDNLEVWEIREGYNEIQRIELSNWDFSLGNFFVNDGSGIITFPGAEEHNREIIVEGNLSGNPSYMDDNASYMELVLNDLVDPDVDYPTEKVVLVTVDGDGFLIEWVGDRQCRNELQLKDGVHPVFPETIFPTFYDDELVEITPPNRIYSTIQDGDDGCGNTIDRRCYHLCYMDALPEEIQLNIEGPSPAYRPCATDYDALRACEEGCRTAFGDCDEMPYSTVPEQEARCECFENLADCLCGCYYGPPEGDPPVTPVLVECQDTCPGGQYAATYLLERVPLVVRDKQSICWYEYEIPAVPFYDWAEDPIIDDGLGDCFSTFTTPFLLRYSLEITYYDCEDSRMFALLTPENLTPFGAFPPTAAGGWNVEFCDPDGETPLTNVIPTPDPAHIVTGLVTTWPVLSGSCELKISNVDPCGIVGVANPDDPEPEVCGHKDEQPVYCGDWDDDDPMRASSTLIVQP